MSQASQRLSPTDESVDSQLLVFVVDDERLIAMTLSLILTHAGFSTAWFTVPEEALRAAVRAAPHLLLSDVAMPTMSGVHLAITMTSRWPTCKVLLLSGQAETADLLCEARSLGFSFRLLSKPIDPSCLLMEIRTILSQPGGRIFPYTE